MSDRFLTAAGDVMAVALSHRVGVPVRPDTPLDIRETPTGLVHFVVGLLGLQECSWMLVPVPHAWPPLRAWSDPSTAGLETREVVTYRFTALEDLPGRPRAEVRHPPQRGDR